MPYLSVWYPLFTPLCPIILTRFASHALETTSYSSFHVSYKVSNLTLEPFPRHRFVFICTIPDGLSSDIYNIRNSIHQLGKQLRKLIAIRDGKALIFL